MAQGYLPGVADEEVEAQDDDDVEADEVENAQVVRVADDQGGGATEARPDPTP